MQVIADASVDLVVSNETLCELDRNGLQRALQEFHRVLMSDGQMVHGELIPAYENEAQRLLIEANLYSVATALPRPAWLSPCADEVAALLHTIGFEAIMVRYLETNLRFSEIKPYKSTTSLARSLGRILHGSKALDPDNNIVVKSDERKVYLIRRETGGKGVVRT